MATPTANPPPAAPIQMRWTRLEDFEAGDAPRPTVGTRFANQYLLGGFDVDFTLGLGWNGFLWTSDDGLSWSEFDPGIDLAGSPINAFASEGEHLVATGPAGFCFMHCDTGLLADQGSTIYLASRVDEWTRLDRPAGLEHGLAGDLVFLNGRILTIGSVKNPDQPADPGPSPTGNESIAMAWTSTDGTLWQPAGDIPTGYGSGPLTVSGGNAVALLDGGFERPDVLVWTGDGENWTETERVSDLETVISHPGGFLAYGWTGDRAFVYTSRDGQAWERGDFNPPLSFFHGAAARVGNAFVAFGEKASDSVMGWQNSVWTSRDGLDWTEQVAPPDFLPDASFHLEPFDDFALLTASGPPGYQVWHIEPE